ncbi:ZIP family metal transporter [Candidatus Microgenomates bacterium]|nr:ZIP family metal transporter [Candidatus Microgenomates bacterium]
MSPQFSNTLLFSVFAGLATILGIYLVVWSKKWVEKNVIYLISFASGVLLSFAFLDLIPEAQELSSMALPLILITFIFFYLLEHSLILHRCRGGQCEEIDSSPHHHLGAMAIFGITLHSLIDGIVIALGFEVSFGLGILATLSVILHEVPEGISSISILLHSGYSKAQSIFYSYIVALATPLGALVALVWIKEVNEAFLGAGLAFSAGSFLYVAASDLIPEVHRDYKILNILFVILGALLPVLTRLTLSE